MLKCFQKKLVYILLLCFSFSLYQAVPAQGMPSPIVTSHIAYAVDANTGKTFYAKNIDSPRSVASLTKIMTTLLVLEGIEQGHFSWSSNVPISPQMKHYAYYDHSGHDFDFSDEETVLELTHLLLVASSNCAASILAEYIAGSEAAFVQKMNERARELSLNASFNDASGLKANAVTARAMVDLSRHMIDNYPGFLELTRQSRGQFRGKSYHSANRLYYNHYYPGSDGIKTGWTPSAGYSFISTAQRAGERVIAIVIGSSSYENEFIDNIKFLDFGFACINGHAQPSSSASIAPEDIAGKHYSSLYNKVNFRSGPGTNFLQLGQVQKGASFIGIHEKNGWYELDYNGQDVWIRKDLVSPTKKPTYVSLSVPTSDIRSKSSDQNVREQNLQLKDERFPTSTWALKDMREASSLGYDFTRLSGRSAFNGSQDLSRAEFCALLVKLYFFNENPDSLHPFLDVSKDTWYHDYIQIAYDKDLISGVASDHFSPESNISREQAATMIARAEKLTSPIFYGYTDEDQVSGYSLESVRGLAHAGIMIGDVDGHFRPQDSITRQEGTVLVLRLHHLHH